MRYLYGSELREYEKWVDKNLRPQMIEALKLPAGKIVQNIETIKKGVKLVEYLKRAENVERQINRLGRK
jgi:hypothetical protein